MQMRVKQECSANEERRKISRNGIRQGNNQKGETKTLGSVRLRSEVKHRHDTQTRQEPPERCKNKTKTRQIINKQKADTGYDNTRLPSVHPRVLL